MESSSSIKSELMLGLEGGGSGWNRLVDSMDMRGAKI